MKNIYNYKYSPRSLSALKALGIDENRLYFVKKEDYISNNPKIKSESKRFKNKCFLNFEINRKNLINRSRRQRNDILKKEKSTDLNNDFVNDSTQYYSNYVLKNKSMTDYWRLRYDKIKEDEQLYLIQKQNLAEVKNLIDETVKLYNKASYNNYDDYIKREEKKNILKYEYQRKKDSELYKKEMMDKELDIIDRKKKEKDFKKVYLKKRLLDEEKEKNYLNEQTNRIRKNKEWENKKKEHIDKVENIYQKKHSSVISEYIDILKKDMERNKILEKRKEEFDHKKQIENEKRDRCLMNFKNINKENENNMRYRFSKKYNHINEFVEEQKEIRNNLIENKKKEREEKEKRNFMLKNINENIKREKQKRLLEQFEINEENVRRRKNINEKLYEDKKYKNYIKYDSITSKYMEQKNILIYQNLLKLKEMREKDLLIKEKIKKRQSSAKLKMNRDNSLIVKKREMINHVMKILDERKEHKIEDVYKRVFSPQEMKLLNINEENYI